MPRRAVPRPSRVKGPQLGVLVAPLSWRSVSAFDGGDNAAPAHIGPHLSRQWATHCTFGQPLRTFHSCRSAHEDNVGRRTAQKSALDVGEPATQCTGEGGRAVHGQGERRAHQFLHLALCPARWLFGHPPYYASRCKGGQPNVVVLDAYNFCSEGGRHSPIIPI